MERISGNTSAVGVRNLKGEVLGTFPLFRIKQCDSAAGLKLLEPLQFGSEILHTLSPHQEINT